MRKDPQGVKFGGKIWGKVRPRSPTKRKNLGSSVTTRCKSWEKVPILGSYLKFRGQNLGYLSFIFLEAKFGAPTRISEAKFATKPPDLLIWKHPLGKDAANSDKIVQTRSDVFTSAFVSANQKKRDSKSE